MNALSIVEHLDVVNQARSRNVAREIHLLGVDEFDLQRREERFHRRVVVAVALAAHALQKAPGKQYLAVLGAGVLAAPIRVNQQTGRRPAIGLRHPEGIDDQFCVAV